MKLQVINLEMRLLSKLISLALEWTFNIALSYFFQHLHYYVPNQARHFVWVDEILSNIESQ